MARKASAVRNFHLPLPGPVYEALRAEAATMSQPATVLARQAIETWLRERQRAALHEAIAAYAVKHAGTDVDLDPALEEAGLAVLRRGSKRRRR